MTAYREGKGLVCDSDSGWEFVREGGDPNEEKIPKGKGKYQHI